MLKWSSDWLDKKDGDGNFLRLVASMKNDTAAHCHLCSNELKFTKLVVHALLQHASTPKHKTNAALRFSHTVRHLVPRLSLTASTSSASSPLVLDLSLPDKVTAAETSWLLRLLKTTSRCVTPIEHHRFFRKCRLVESAKKKM